MSVYIKLSLSVLLLIASAVTIEASNEDYASSGVRALLHVYDECLKSDSGFAPCIKKKAITFVDRVSRIDSINVGEGLKVIKLTDPTNVPLKIQRLNETLLEKTLPRSLEARDEILSNLLLDRLAGFISGHTLQISLPKVSSDDLGRGLEEGRGKMKKMMGMMMMGFAMKMAALIPVAIAGLYLLAGKALIVSKIALLLAGIIGIKKLLSSKQSGSGSSGWTSGGGNSGGGGGGWSSGGGGGGHGGGWDRRSIDEAQSLAYKAYSN